MNQTLNIAVTSDPPYGGPEGGYRSDPLEAEAAERGRAPVASLLRASLPFGVRLAELLPELVGRQRRVADALVVAEPKAGRRDRSVRAALRVGPSEITAAT